MRELERLREIEAATREFFEVGTWDSTRLMAALAVEPEEDSDDD